MKAIVVTDQDAGTAGMKLVERPEPQAAINDVVVQVHASVFTWDELTWPSTWTDRLGRDRTPVIPGQELAGVVSALGYGTTGLSVGQRVFGLTDSYRGGTLAEYVAVEARNLAPPTVRRRSTSARRSSSTSRTTPWKTSAQSIWFSMSSAATSGSGPHA
jgi:NADPH:quinone reductase-like Zn-dependent oxidoreductase